MASKPSRAVRRGQRIHAGEDVLRMDAGMEPGTRAPQQRVIIPYYCYQNNVNSSRAEMERSSHSLQSHLPNMTQPGSGFRRMNSVVRTSCICLSLAAR